MSAWQTLELTSTPYLSLLLPELPKATERSQVNGRSQRTLGWSPKQWLRVRQLKTVSVIKTWASVSLLIIRHCLCAMSIRQLRSVLAELPNRFARVKPSGRDKAFQKKIWLLRDILLLYLYILFTILTNNRGWPSMSKTKRGGSEGHHSHETRDVPFSLGCGGALNRQD